VLRRLVLTIVCPDRNGIVAAVSGCIAANGGAIVEAAQHGDAATGHFFQRIEVISDDPRLAPSEFPSTFAPVATEFDMAWRLWDTEQKKRVVILASREEHCVADLLHRWRVGDLDCEIPAVLSNHEHLKGLVEWHGIDFVHLPFDDASADTAMEEVARRFETARGDVMVLARFMRILPPWLCERYAARIINIHHSFLPSFAGVRPYHQALERGVKLIGATCHYVTAELDAGPIIEQDTARIHHSDSVEDLVRMGRDIERVVLATGLRWHLQDRVLLNGTRTVVFR
jgi:formyltetrahydrofolate deformylase